MAVQIICQTCGNTFRVKQSRAATAKYCTHACKTAARVGRKRAEGYVRIYRPDHPNRDCNGYVLEHRIVMEHMLGRLLEPHEVVHHVNWVKDDNRPENLELFSTHSQHMQHHTEDHAPNFNPLNTATERQCSRCRIVKPLTTEFFAKDKTDKYGFDYRCRECERLRWRTRSHD